MAPRPFLLGMQSGQAASPAVSSERLLNGYVEQVPSGREPTPVYGSPGLIRFGGIDRVRAITRAGDRLFVLADSLYEVMADGAATDLGPVPGGFATMAADGATVVVTVAGQIWVWNGTTLGRVTDPDAPEASSVTFINGFYVFTETDADQFFTSPMNDPSGDYDALDFDSADSSPDKLVGSLRIGRDLILFGSQSVEFWYYSGDATFPFNRYDDTPLDVGLAGALAATRAGETAYWLASDNTVRRLDGRVGSRVSTFAIETQIEKWADPSQTVVSSHVWRGHLFITLRNPDGCVEYDEATKLWHDRGSFNSPTWRGGHYAYAFGKHIVGGDRLYEFGGYDEDGETLPFEMVTPWLDQKGQKFAINNVELRMQPGTGSLTLDPKVSLSRTEDGESWTAPKLRSFGKQGQRQRRVQFGRQGSSRGCAFKVRITDPAERVVFAGYVDVS